MIFCISILDKWKIELICNSDIISMICDEWSCQNKSYYNMTWEYLSFLEIFYVFVYINTLCIYNKHVKNKNYDLNNFSVSINPMHGFQRPKDRNISKTAKMI